MLKHGEQLKNDKYKSQLPIEEVTFMLEQYIKSREHIGLVSAMQMKIFLNEPIKRETEEADRDVFLSVGLDRFYPKSPIIQPKELLSFSSKRC
jgi:hypothetical protein